MPQRFISQKVRPAAGWSRRRFLRAGGRALAGASAGVMIVPGSVLGRGGQAAPGSRITMGMIGVGRQAMYANLPAFLAAPDAQVVAVCDVDAWRLERARQKVEDYYAAQANAGSHRSCRAYRDFRELLARPDIDAVMISTPDHWHVPMSIAAVEAGKDVACEKPLTRGIAEGRRLSDCVTKHQRVFRTDSEFRSIGKFHRVVELVRNGYLGKLHTIRAGVPETDVALPQQPVMPIPPELDYDFWLGPAPAAPYTEKRVHPRHNHRGRPGWMRVRDYCDGLITNWGAHLNDIAQWGNNTERTGPVEVAGTGEFAPPDGLWNVLLKFRVEYRYANGVRLRYQSSHPYIRFEGSEGWLQVDYPDRLTASSEALRKAKAGPRDKIHFPLKSEKRDFLDAVKSRKPTLEDAEVGHRTTSLCLLGLIAVQTGRRLRWDPARERFPDDPEANRLLHRPPLRPPWDVY